MCIRDRNCSHLTPLLERIKLLFSLPKFIDCKTNQLRIPPKSLDTTLRFIRRMLHNAIAATVSAIVAQTVSATIVLYAHRCTAFIRDASGSVMVRLALTSQVMTPATWRCSPADTVFTDRVFRPRVCVHALVISIDLRQYLLVAVGHGRSRFSKIGGAVSSSLLSLLSLPSFPCPGAHSLRPARGPGQYRPQPPNGFRAF